jgi:hypothetical protein
LSRLPLPVPRSFRGHDGGHSATRVEGCPGKAGLGSRAPEPFDDEPGEPQGEDEPCHQGWLAITTPPRVLCRTTHGTAAATRMRCARNSKVMPLAPALLQTSQAAHALPTTAMVTTEVSPPKRTPTQFRCTSGSEDATAVLPRQRHPSEQRPQAIQGDLLPTC